MDKIIMKNLMFFAYHGVLPEENRLGQKFCISVQLDTNLKKAGITDKVEDTINYAEVYQCVKHIVENKKYKLLEALAENISKEILTKFEKVEEVKITIEKPEAPVSGIFDYFAVEIRRKRNE